MTRIDAIGARIGRALAALVPDAIAARVREYLAARYGRCRICGEPLGGPSRERLCDSVSCETTYVGMVYVSRFSDGIAEGERRAREQGWTIGGDA